VNRSIRRDFAQEIFFTTVPYSQNWDHFEDVVHAYPESYSGISAAAGYLAGRKIAVPDHWDGVIPLPVEGLDEKSKVRLVVHGMSVSLYRFVKGFVVRYPDTKLFLVWHGNMAQLTNIAEQELFLLFCDLRKYPKFERSSSIRFDQSSHLPSPWSGALLNSPPRLIGNKKQWGKSAPVALCPSWSDLRKNLFFNIALGVQNQQLKQVQHYQEIGHLGKILNTSKLKRVNHGNRASHFERTSHATIVLNISTIDCQPMVDLETLATGTKLLCKEHAPISKILKHPIFDLIYADAFDFDKSKRMLNELLSLSEAEWFDLNRSFLEMYTEKSMTSWLEFLN
jgi:hypothetical protein